MGSTLTERNQDMYYDFIKSGLTHNEAIEMFPKSRRKQVIEDLDKGIIESHFGMKPLHFLILLLLTIIGTILFAIIYG